MQAADTSRNAMDDMLADAEAEAKRSVIACLECGTEIDVSHQDITADDFVPDCPTCNTTLLRPLLLRGQCHHHVKGVLA